MANFGRKYIPLLIIFLSSALLMAGLLETEITNINCRFALMTSEIDTYGIGPFASLYGKPYTDYPSLMMVLMYWATGCGRWVNMLTLALPTIVTTIYLLIMTYEIGKFVSIRLGIYGVLLTLFAFEFLNIARAPSLDIFVAAATVTAIYALLRVDFGRSRGWWALVPFCLAFGYAFRGPMGLVIPAAAVVGYFAVRHEWKRMALWGMICFGTLAATSALFMFWVFLHGGQAEMMCFFEDQILSRFGSSKPPWYFFADAAGSYALTYILGLIVIAVYLPKLWRKPNPETETDAQYLLRALVAWVLIVLVGMSIPGTKHLRYVVPVLPAMGLLAAWIFLNFDHFKLFNRLRTVLLTAFRLAVPILLIGWIGAKIAFSILLPEIRLPFILPITIFVVLLPVVWYISPRTASTHRETLLLCTAVICMSVVKIMMYDPLMAQRESSRQWVREIESMRGPQNTIVFYNFGPDGDEHKYMINLPPEKRYIPQYVSVSDKPSDKEPDSANVQRLRALCERFVNLFPADQPGEFPPARPMFEIFGTRQKLLEFPAGTWFLSREKHFKILTEKSEYADRFEVLSRGQMGHQECVLFTLAEDAGE